MKHYPIVPRSGAGLVMVFVLCAGCGGSASRGSNGGAGGGGSQAGGAGGRGNAGGGAGQSASGGTGGITSGAGGAAGLGAGGRAVGTGGAAGRIGGGGTFSVGGRAGGGGTGNGGGSGRGGASGNAGAGGGTGGGAGGAGGTPSCGGATCAADRYCDWMDNRCAVNGLLPGSCQLRPQVCTADVDPVCGCDGQVYSNTCEASVAGQDVSSRGGCTPPAGRFACGQRFCSLTAEYCEAMLGPGPLLIAGLYACHPFPASCGSTPTCACLTGTNCGNCMTLPGGGVMTACLYP